MYNFLHILATMVSTEQLTIILIVVAAVFFVFIGIAIIKMYKLKAENKKLMETNAYNSLDDTYKDFTGGHLYGDN
ncbi:hypothetical protein [Winogradskyella sp. A3E31]|uniref:hypothetical protein n=1 Tax=Winogradskyella sp. A3E31 TaxID=3349637 RepID=UPI00398B927D